MEWQPLAEWAIKGIMGGALLHGVRVLSKMNASIEDLNAKVAMMLEKTSWHEKELARIESRIVRLETIHTKKR